MSFWVNYAGALALIAVVLTLLALAGRFVRRVRPQAGSGNSLAVVESAMLSPNAGVHVVRAGQRCFLVGATAATVRALAEIDLSDDPRST